MSQWALPHGQYQFDPNRDPSVVDLRYAIERLQANLESLASGVPDTGDWRTLMQGSDGLIDVQGGERWFLGVGESTKEGTSDPADTLAARRLNVATDFGQREGGVWFKVRAALFCNNTAPGAGFVFSLRRIDSVSGIADQFRVVTSTLVDAAHETAAVTPLASSIQEVETAPFQLDGSSVWGLSYATSGSDQANDSLIVLNQSLEVMYG